VKKRKHITIITCLAPGTTRRKTHRGENRTFYRGDNSAESGDEQRHQHQVGGKRKGKTKTVKKKKKKQKKKKNHQKKNHTKKTPQNTPQQKKKLKNLTEGNDGQQQKRETRQAQGRIVSLLCSSLPQSLLFPVRGIEHRCVVTRSRESSDRA